MGNEEGVRNSFPLCKLLPNSPFPISCSIIIIILCLGSFVEGNGFTALIMNAGDTMFEPWDISNSGPDFVFFLY